MVDVLGDTATLEGVAIEGVAEPVELTTFDDEPLGVRVMGIGGDEVIGVSDCVVWVGPGVCVLAGADVTGDVGIDVGGNVDGKEGCDVGGNVDEKVGCDVAGNVGGKVGCDVAGDEGGKVDGAVAGDEGGKVGGKVGGAVAGDVSGDEVCVVVVIGDRVGRSDVRVSTVVAFVVGLGTGTVTYCDET